jgi:hypothetical protein
MKNKPTSEALTAAISIPSAKCQFGLREMKEMPTVTHVNTISTIRISMYVAGEIVLDDMNYLLKLRVFHLRSIWLLTRSAQACQPEAGSLFLASQKRQQSISGRSGAGQACKLSASGLYLAHELNAGEFVVIREWIPELRLD